MKTLIIEKPSLAPLPNRIGWAFFTAIFWIAWFYLWMPLITLFLWWLGIRKFDHYFIHITGSEFANFTNLLIFYSIVVAALAGSLLAWATSEFLRFRNATQRTRPSPVEIVELAEIAKIPTSKMIELTSTRRMIAHHDEHGNFMYADVL